MFPTLKNLPSRIINLLVQAFDRKTIYLRKEALVEIERKLAAHLVSPASPPPLSPGDWEIVERIRTETLTANRNNVTRTEAYRQIYFRHPELHWAFLAHMVSRNGGWNMTDLQGEYLPALLTAKERNYYFQFLERANALIFQDAYPQLLLYEESLKRGRNLFHLLPAFHVSAFMGPVWEYFWETRDSALLTVALIINEQNYIEQRVAQHPYYQQHVFQSLAFKTQALLQLNQILIPYVLERSQDEPPKLHLAGRVLEDFTDLKERIEIGKQLYAILFGIPAVHTGARLFAQKVPHTGSRADYWPHLFHSEKKPASPFPEQRLKGCQLKKGAPRIYSPSLTDAWQDFPFSPPDRSDWLRDLSPLKYLEKIKMPHSYEMTRNACKALNRIELAVLAAKQLDR